MRDKLTVNFLVRGGRGRGRGRERWERLSNGLKQSQVIVGETYIQLSHLNLWEGEGGWRKNGSIHEKTRL